MKWVCLTMGFSYFSDEGSTCKPSGGVVEAAGIQESGDKMHGMGSFWRHWKNHGRVLSQVAIASAKWPSLV